MSEKVVFHVVTLSQFILIWDVLKEKLNIPVHQQTLGLGQFLLHEEWHREEKSSNSP